MRRHRHTIEIDRPAHAIFERWKDFESYPEFMSGVEEVRRLNDATIHWVMDITGEKHEFDAIITRLDEDQCLSWTATDASREHAEVLLTPVDPDHTQLTLTVEYEPDGIKQRSSDWIGLVDRRLRGDLERFKELAESGSGPESPEPESPRPASP